MYKKIITLLVLLCSLSSFSKGIVYEKLSNEDSSSIHLLIVDPKIYNIAPVKAGNDARPDRESVLTLAHRYGAVAAINGGFWKADGTPAGILKINNHWYGTPLKPRGAIGWSTKSHKVLIDQILTADVPYIYPWTGPVDILPLSNPPYTQSAEWQELEHIVGGAPILVHKGLPIEDFSLEQLFPPFITKPHSRTAVGIKENGDWLFLVIDEGISLSRLAHLMLQLGCVEALNLDGGGSSTMVILDAVVNEPHGTLEEKGKQVEAVSDAILISPR